MNYYPMPNYIIINLEKQQIKSQNLQKLLSILTIRNLKFLVSTNPIGDIIPYLSLDYNFKSEAVYLSNDFVINNR